MKPFGLINMGVLPLLLEAMAPGYAQHDQREHDTRRPNQEQEAKPERQPQEAKPERQERPQPAKGQEGRQHPQEAKPEKQPPQARPPDQEQPQRARGQQERPHQQEAKGQQGQRPPQQSVRNPQEPKKDPQRPRQAIRPSKQKQPGRQGEQRAIWQKRRAKNWRSEHRTWQERGGYNGYRIPEDRYRSHFGPSHAFRIYSYPLVVFGGYPRFQFGGFWFSVVDPWPEYWSDSWYDDDDVYIDYAGDGYYLYNRRYPGDRITISVNLN